MSFNTSDIATYFSILANKDKNHAHNIRAIQIREAGRSVNVSNWFAAKVRSKSTQLAGAKYAPLVRMISSHYWYEPLVRI